MSTFVLAYFHIYYRIILILESSLELYQNMTKESLNLVMGVFCDRNNSILPLGLDGKYEWNLFLTVRVMLGGVL